MPDIFAIGLAVLGFVALQRLHRQVQTVVLWGATIGLAWVLGRAELGI